MIALLFHLQFRFIIISLCKFVEPLVTAIKFIAIQSGTRGYLFLAELTHIFIIFRTLIASSIRSVQMSLTNLKG